MVKNSTCQICQGFGRRYKLDGSGSMYCPYCYGTGKISADKGNKKNESAF
jgi:hypothetical protein